MKILRELRESASLTLRQVEEATSISNAYLSQLETGKIKKPSAQVLYVLAKLYSVEVEKLLIEAGMVKEINIKPVKMKPSVEQQMASIEKRLTKIKDQLSLNQNFS